MLGLPSRLKLSFPKSASVRPGTNPRGFTMIETIIVILVIGILAAIATPSFLSWVRNKEVDDALAQVVGAFKEAQSEALRKGTGCRVNIDTSSKIISATTMASSADNCLPTGKRNLKDASDAIQITTDFTGIDELIFTHKKTTPEDGIVVLFQPEASQQRCVVVSEGLGLIRTGFYQGNPTTPSINNCNRNP